MSIPVLVSYLVVMVSDLYIDDNGLPRKLSHLEAVNKIIELRRKGDMWEVIDVLLDLWSSTAPSEVDAMSINLEEYKESLVDKEFATTKGGGEMNRRFFLSFPKKLMFMIRTQYKTDELQFDRAFYNKFAKRYPFFRVSEKV